MHLTSSQTNQKHFGSQHNLKNNKRTFHLNNQEQGIGKRENFRLEIRRKAIEQYQRGVRKQWSIGQDFESKCPIMSKYSDRIFQGEQQEYQNQQEAKNQSRLKQPCDQTQFSQFIENLQEMQLTHPSELCTKSSLCFLREIGKQETSQHVTDKISRILMKISINQLYWDEEFLTSFIELLDQISRCHKGQMDMLQYLANLSQCNILQFKIIIYGLIMRGSLFERQLQKANHTFGKSSTSKSKILEIIGNLLLAPPIVSHGHSLLHRFAFTTENYISKLMTILTNLSKITSSGNEKFIRTQNKDQCLLLEVLYGLCSRLEHSQLGHILSWLHKQNNKWQILHQAMQKYANVNSQTSDREKKTIVYDNSNSRAMEVKLKYKLLQINQVIMQFCIYNQDYHNTGLQFVYDLLPQLLSIVVGDLSNFIYKFNPTCPTPGRNKAKCSQSTQFQQSYELLLLRVLYTVLNVKDELNGPPALEYISVRYTSLFQDITEHYCLGGQAEYKKSKIVIWICEIVVSYLPQLCSRKWVSNFICYLIWEHKLDQTKNETLLSLLETTEQILETHQQQPHSCLLLAGLKDQKIVKKLEDIAIYRNESNYYNANNNTSREIIRAVDNILSYIYLCEQTL